MTKIDFINKVRGSKDWKYVISSSSSGERYHGDATKKGIKRSIIRSNLDPLFEQNFKLIERHMNGNDLEINDKKQMKIKNAAVSKIMDVRNFFNEAIQKQGSIDKEE